MDRLNLRLNNDSDNTLIVVVVIVFCIILLRFYINLTDLSKNINDAAPYTNRVWSGKKSADDSIVTPMRKPTKLENMPPASMTSTRKLIDHDYGKVY